jgi:alpha-D-ribose 1-methylphosphonate 5-triphosphate synthase subunit PhnG
VSRFFHSHVPPSSRALAERDKRRRLKAEIDALTQSSLKSAELEAIAERVRRAKRAQTFYRPSGGGATKVEGA